MKTIFSIIIGLFLTSPLFAQDKVIAEVFDRKITEAELERALSNDLYELQRNMYELKQRKVDEMLGNIVLEKEAARKKVNVQELLDKEVNKKIPKISDKEVDKFYDQQKDHLKGDKAQYIDRIKNFLQNQKYNETLQRYLDKLKKQARAKVFLDKPSRPRMTLNLTPAPMTGKATAKVQLVEFSDFQCPFCSGLAKTLRQVSKKYGSSVNLIFKAFPLTFHKDSPLAHQASFCADDQGKFWQFHDKLFENQQKLDRASLEQHAQDLKLDMAKFKQCIDSGEKFAKVQKETMEGQEAGVRSTPTFFINGQMMVGNLPQEAIEEAINEELAKK